MFERFVSKLAICFNVLSCIQRHLDHIDLSWYASSGSDCNIYAYPNDHTNKPIKMEFVFIKHSNCKTLI